MVSALPSPVGAVSIGLKRKRESGAGDRPAGDTVGCGAKGAVGAVRRVGLEVHTPLDGRDDV